MKREKKGRNYVAVLFISEAGKVLLAPEGDQYTLPARMSEATTHAVASIFCNIFDMYLVGQQSSDAAIYETVEDDGVLATYRIVWVKVKHPEARFLRWSRWYSPAELASLDFSAVASIALAQAVTDGVMQEQEVVHQLVEAA